MTIRVEDEIKELMYEANSVVIPGLGAFQSKYKSAYTDGIQGNIAPPSLEITFDPNIIINDGVLVDFLKKKYQTTTQTAQQTIDAYIENANATFEKHELVIIPEVGRLFRDFTNKIQFLPDTTNFNTDTFGLPVAQFYPVSRTNTEKTAAVEAILGEAEPSLVKPPFPEATEKIPYPNLTANTSITPIPNWWHKYVPYVTVGVLLLLIYAIYNNSQSKKEAGYKAANENIKINVPPPVKPTPDEPQPPVAATPPAPAKEDPQIAHEKTTQLPPQSNDNSTTLTTPSVSKKKLLVMLGGYADKKNIARHIKWIGDNGYGLYQKQGNNMVLLGAEVEYADNAELKKILRNLRGRFGEAVQIKGKI